MIRRSARARCRVWLHGGFYPRTFSSSSGSEAKGRHGQRARKTRRGNGLIETTRDMSLSHVRQLDLCFCMDLTNSMKPFIDSARKSLIQILEGTATRHAPGLSLRVGVVGYRDFTRDYISFIRERIDDGDSVDQLQLGISPMFQLEGGADATHMSGQVIESLLTSYSEKKLTAPGKSALLTLKGVFDKIDRVRHSVTAQRAQALPPVEMYDFTGDLDKVRNTLYSLKAKVNENPDVCEAVLSGLSVACHELSWRRTAARVLVLAGDAPPHACGGVEQSMFKDYADAFPDGDPSGYDLNSMGSLMVDKNVVCYAMGLVPSQTPEFDGLLTKSFLRLTNFSGGRYYNANSPHTAMDIIQDISDYVVAQMAHDERVWEHLHRRGGDGDESRQGVVRRIAGELRISEGDVESGLERLYKRNLIEAPRDSTPRSGDNDEVIYL